jgi:putative component of toxin-antitoxin plasmid stabilization module
MRDAVRVVYTDPFLSDLRTLSPEQRERVVRRINNAERIGWTAGVRTGNLVPLRDGIWELRILGRGAAYRVLFARVPDGMVQLLVLTTFSRKSDLKKRSVMDAEIRRARARLAHWLEQRG